MMFYEILFWCSISGIIYAYIGYPVVLWLLKRTVPAKYPDESIQKPAVSIVIAAYNEEAVIGERLDNCLALRYPKELLEVCVGSDGSTDATNHIVAQYGDRGVRLFDYAMRRGKVNVLNDTVPRAKGQIIVFTDANTHFDADVIELLVRHFHDERVGAVCGSVEFTTPGDGNIGSEGLYWRLERWLKTQEGMRGAVIGASGPNFAIRAELFHKCPEDTITEDFVISMKIVERGYRVVYEPEARASEQAGLDTNRELERRSRIGAGNFQSLMMLLPLLDPRRGFVAFAFWSHKVLRWVAPHMMGIALVTNIMLLGSRFYLLLFLGQFFFYGLALVGWTTGQHTKLRWARACQYFVAMNIGLFLGFCRFIMSTQPVTWQRTER